MSQQDSHTKILETQRNGIVWYKENPPSLWKEHWIRCDELHFIRRLTGFEKVEPFNSREFVTKRHRCSSFQLLAIFLWFAERRFKV